MKLTVSITPQELRKMLEGTGLEALYDGLVGSMEELGCVRVEAEGIIAPLMLDAIQRLIKGKVGPETAPPYQRES